MPSGAMAAAKVLVAAVAIASCTSAQELGLNVESDGNYTITFDGKLWLSGSEYRVGDSSSSDGSLILQGEPTTSTGTDAIGDFDATTLKWAKSGSTVIVFETSFRTYKADPGAIVFEQSFPTSLTLDMAKQYIEKPAPSESFDKCRIVAAGRQFSITGSQQGYSAYTPSGSNFSQHKSAYCDDGHQWSFTSDSDSLEECEAKCTAVKCACFDYRDGSTPSPSTSQSAQTIFPGFNRAPGPTDKMDTISYHGVFPSYSLGTVADYQDSHMGGCPLAIYDSTNSSLPMVILSPLNQPMAQHFDASASYFGAGIKATVETIPAGWSQLFLLSASSGINDGFMAWGNRMLAYTGKSRANMYLDQTHSTIGFWTDNGGYYHYSIGTGEGDNYGEVLPKVKAYHDSIGVPFGHWQFDSWFYPKDGPVNGGGGGGAVVNWTAMPSVFPQGMAGIQNQLKLPTVMHNRQWSDKSDYIKNLPQFKWYTDKYAIPEDPDAFFNWFFQQQKGWGLSMYEQDWMCTEYDGVAHLQTNISMGDLWLKGMADGARSSNRTVQYCMPYANEVLAAAAFPAVSNARATGDYFHGFEQWAVGGTSLFYWAIGILPFKDGFYSSTNKQVGGQTVGPETHPDREAIMATLSGAMVGPMDGIFLLNKSRTMTTCRGDGMVLKPDKPVSTSDWCFAQPQLKTSSRSGTCHVYSTFSSHNVGRVHYLFLNTPAPIAPSMVYASASDKYVVYNFYTGKATALTTSTDVDAGYEDTVYAIVSPVLSNGWAFVGEATKYVTASKSRFLDVSATSSGLSVSVAGVAGETVSVSAVQSAAMDVTTKHVTFATSGTQTVTF